jgi:ADP-ribose pyrophosphatase YjhB (NUDIX family)
MKLFVNDKYIHIISTENFAGAGAYDLEISPDIALADVKLQGRVLVWGGNPAYMDALLLQMEVKKLKKLDHVDFVTDRYDEVKNFIKDQFKIVKAAGGLVFKGEKMLMIYRLSKWDLPKGKLDKGEKTIDGALREVVEECAISVAADEKITSTWHTYVYEGRRILKKTTWYRMTCLSDAGMKPQIEENIEDIRWMTRGEVELALGNSYNSIREVFASYWHVVTSK